MVRPGLQLLPDHTGRTVFSCHVLKKWGIPRPRFLRTGAAPVQSAACAACPRPPSAVPDAGWPPRLPCCMNSQVLEARGISCLELPMVETAAGPDREKLPEVRQGAPHVILRMYFSL